VKCLRCAAANNNAFAQLGQTTIFSAVVRNQSFVFGLTDFLSASTFLLRSVVCWLLLYFHQIVVSLSAAVPGGHSNKYPNCANASRKPQFPAAPYIALEVL